MRARYNVIPIRGKVTQNHCEWQKCTLPHSLRVKLSPTSEITQFLVLTPSCLSRKSFCLRKSCPIQSRTKCLSFKQYSRCGVWPQIFWGLCGCDLPSIVCSIQTVSISDATFQFAKKKKKILSHSKPLPRGIQVKVQHSKKTLSHNNCKSNLGHKDKD